MALAKYSSLDHDRYTVGDLLAEGGMGAVYTAYDSRFKKRVALKENFFQDEESIQQFETEAFILHDLNHPGLPGVDNHFMENGKQYLVMEFIDGQNIWEMVRVNPNGEQAISPLPEKQALDYIIQVCQAVIYLHQQEPPIIHRDIKPENIRISENRAVLVDFGIAKVMSSAKTHIGAAGWTDGYAPPEQYGVLTTTPKSDIYALGATLYAILSATVPPSSMRLMLGEVSLEPLERLNPKLNPELYKAVSHAMQMKPIDRPQTVGDWQAELTAILADSDNLAQKPAPVVKDKELPAATTKSAGGRKLGKMNGKQRSAPMGLAVAIISSVITTFGLDNEEQAIVNHEIKWLFSAADSFLKIHRGEVDRSRPVAVPIPPDAERAANANNQLLSTLDEFDMKIWQGQIASIFKRINTLLRNLNILLDQETSQGSAGKGNVSLQNQIRGGRLDIVKILQELALLMNEAYGVLITSPDQLIEFAEE